MQKQNAIKIFNAAVAAVQPSRLLQQHLRINNQELFISGQRIASLAQVCSAEECGGVLVPTKRIYIIGAGKAAAAMAIATENILGDHLTAGLVTTKYGHALPTKKITIIEAAHPVPDENSITAVAQTLQLIKNATKEDIIICLISGGASALWCDIPPGSTLPEVQTTFDLLIRSGANIHEINTVRKHLSGIKGGQLPRHTNGARIFSLIISDVPGDDLSAIASGPTVPDTSTFQEAHAILSKYKLLQVLPQSIRTHIEKGVQGSIAETPGPGDPLFNKTVNHIIGNNHRALQAAAQQAKELGYHTYIVPRLITGDATTAAKDLVTRALKHQHNNPVCILQGGETTVQVTGHGKGGRNQHIALAALRELGRQSDIVILSGGTDGTDGPTEAAGGVVDATTFQRALQQQLNIETYLTDNNAFHFLQQTDSLLITGPTQTNVMDIMIALVQ